MKKEGMTCKIPQAMSCANFVVLFASRFLVQAFIFLFRSGTCFPVFMSLSPFGWAPFHVDLLVCGWC